MISVLHTWGRILAVAGGVFGVLLAVPAFRFGRGLEDMPEDRDIRSDPGTLHGARGTGPELGRRFLEWLRKVPYPKCFDPKATVPPDDAP
jgi:hypothetical protein